jgi:hypothetical protein
MRAFAEGTVEHDHVHRKPVHGRRRTASEFDKVRFLIL